MLQYSAWQGESPGSGAECKIRPPHLSRWVRRHRTHIIESRPDMIESRPETRALAQLLARYRQPDSARGVFELIITAGPFTIIWAVMCVVLLHGYWGGLLLAGPAAGL